MMNITTYDDDTNLFLDYDSLGTNATLFARVMSTKYVFCQTTELDLI